MALVALTSAGPSPGVTTTALALAMEWPRPVLLVDADRTPSQSVLAGYLRGETAGPAGLGGLLQASREGRPLEEALEREIMELPSATGANPVAFLPGFPHPGTVGLFESVWPDLVAALDSRAGDVLIDAGRMGPTGLPSSLVTAADLVLVCTGTALTSLAALRLYLPLVTDATADAALLLVGPGRPYGRSEVQSQFATTIAAGIAYAPTHAAVLSDGAPPPRRFAESAYLRSVAAAARSLSGRLQAARQLIGARR